MTTKKADHATHHSIDDVEVTELVGGEQMTGGFPGPYWAPDLGDTFTDLKPKAVADKLAKMPQGSSTRPKIGGRLAVVNAWGRRLYALKIGEGPSMILAKLPEHEGLRLALNRVKLDARVTVEYKGRSLKAAAPGRMAPHTYHVIAERGAALPEERADAVQRREHDDDKKAIEPPADDLAF